MDHRAPFPSVEENANRSREETRLSLAIGSLLERRDQIKALIDPLLEEHELACRQVADAEGKFIEAEARAYLDAKGPVEERKRKARLVEAVAVAASDMAEAKMMKRITEKALHVREKDLDCLTALAHSHNRELKVFEG